VARSQRRRTSLSPRAASSAPLTFTLGTIHDGEQCVLDFFYLTSLVPPTPPRCLQRRSGQLILRPYGWTDDVSPHEAEHNSLGAAMAEAIRQTSGETYTSQPSIALYPTSGSASDWCELHLNDLCHRCTKRSYLRLATG